MFNQTWWIKVTKQRSRTEMIINVNNIVAISEPRKIILVNGEVDVEESYDELIQMITNYYGE